MRRLFFVIITIVSAFYLQAKDIKVGKREWAEISKGDTIKLQPGDNLLFKCGEVYEGAVRIMAEGTSDMPVTIGEYGKGAKPRIVASDTAQFAMLIYNSRYVKIQNLDISNHGTEPQPGRTGLKVEADNCGYSKCISIKSIDIHDVNGSLSKEKGGGSGLLIVNKWTDCQTAFDSLLIEDCMVRRCQRNAMIWHSNYNRDRWFPNRHVVVRKCLIEEVPGDGIVPIGCEGAVIEYNIMRNCPDILPDEEAAAGFWPWSCDNTIIQFNEVSDHKAHWDGQAYDCDYNSNNTTIRYNYSHDNYGGFLLVCTPKVKGYNIGNRGSVIHHNISINDGLRPYPARGGEQFSPAIHISGPCYNTRIDHNVIFYNVRDDNDQDKNFIYLGFWDGYAESTYILDNVFFAESDSVGIDLTKSKKNYFAGNATYKTDKAGDLKRLLRKMTIAGGQAELLYVNREMMEDWKWL